MGSHAREEARSDSDIDLVVICNNPIQLLKDLNWLEYFGKVMKYNIEDWGAIQSIRTFYQDGQEIEFGITSPKWAAHPIDTGTQKVLSDGAKILIDKNDLLAKLINLAEDKE